MIPAMVVGPVMQLLALGYAANMDVSDIPLVLVDQDRSAESRGWSSASPARATFELVGARGRRRRPSSPGCVTGGPSSRS